MREILRNLTTSQGTRVATGKDDLLSIFPDREKTASILAHLIDSRLLTSSSREVEIVHESLLTAWPRLVQWQAQDAEGSVLRDHVALATVGRVDVIVSWNFRHIVNLGRIRLFQE